MKGRFENDLNTVLAAGADRVDQRTRDELARRRREVLATVDNARSPGRLWMPVGGVAAAVLAALLVQPFFNDQMPDPAVVDQSDIDMEILLAEEGLELYEDLEFFEWLGVVDDAG